MQIFIQDVRELGNKKILLNFAQSEGGKIAFLERLRLQNMMLSGYKSTAFSLPKAYKTLYPHIRAKYCGMEYFMSNCEPLILSLDDPDKSIQRKFRNLWDKCWDSFGKSTNLSEDTSRMLRNLGIRMCFGCESEFYARLDAEVFEFYNVVLKWFVYTSTEGSIAETGLTLVQLLERMVLRQPELFVHDIQEGF